MNQDASNSKNGQAHGLSTTVCSESDDELWDRIQGMSKEELREIHGMSDEEIERNCREIQERFNSQNIADRRDSND